MPQARDGCLMQSQPTILSPSVPPQDLDCVVYIHFEEGVQFGEL